MINQREEWVWFQKYRPKTVQECILPASIKDTFSNFVKEGRIPNFLLSGTAGVGKTTIALALCEELKADVMFINSSEESGIDVLRNKIKSFASTISLNDSKKVVILDEADHLSQQASAALRGLIEEFSNNCSFILTCNFKNKIMDAIQSRCISIDFKIEGKDKLEIVKLFFKRCIEILKAEEIEYDSKVVAELVQKHFPDFRKVINELQGYSVSGKIDSGILINVGDESYKELFKSLKDKNFTDVRKWIGKNSDLESSVLFRKLFDRCDDFFVQESIPNLIIILGDYQDKASRVVDQEINNIAALTEIMSSCRFL